MNDAAAFGEVLADAGLVYLDAGVVALHLSGDPGYLPLTRAILGGMRDGDFQGFTSAITVYQLLVEPFRSGQPELAVQDRLQLWLQRDPGAEDTYIPVSGSPAAAPITEDGLVIADLLVSPRVKGENTPFKVYTFLASGRPLLATRIPTHTQLLDDDLAWLVEPFVLRIVSNVIECCPFHGFGILEHEGKQ